MALIPIENKRGGSAIAKTLYLYKNGDEYTSKTGGWYVARNTSDNTVTNSSGVLTVTRNGDGGEITTRNAIDLTDYCKLKCKLTSITSGRNLDLALQDSSQHGINGGLVAYNRSNAIGEHSLDISAYSGNYYPCVNVQGGNGSLSVSEVWLEPYPTRLSDGELYSYGLGINDWDNTGYTLGSGWTNKGGFTINSKSISGTVPTLVGAGSDITIIYNTKIDLSQYSRVIVTTNEGEYTADISALTETTYLIMCMWSSGSERAFRVCFNQQKDNYSSDRQHEFNLKMTTSYFSITIYKVRLE